MSAVDTDPAVRAPAEVRGDYAKLSTVIRDAGLLDRRLVYYTVKVVLNLLVFAAGWVAFAFIGDSWWQLLVAVFFAVMFAQLSFIGHDAGHRQVFRTGKANDTLGRAHGGLVGLSYIWWIDQHNRHHANPNHEQNDPDLDIAVIAFTGAQSGAKRGLPRMIAKHQAVLFFPLLLLEGISLHLSSVQTLLRNKTRYRRLELCLLFGHFAVYLAAVFLVLSPLTAVVFILIHQCLWGLYMGCSFAPGHKGMPTIGAGQRIDFLRKQVLTSRNIRGNVFVDFVLGGLNYQIEHHLFPTMARPNLRKAQPLVREFCTQQGIDYAQCGWLRTYGYVLQHLHAVSAPLRTASQ
ncbi:fatty acid desaturase family protein [Sciscionella marina]|uniref:fatty acid desaturase family protein n=1 Tax=Sciscionella marina TaxID=508770 RepID=UPI00036ED04C|nr:acyl-CoA desaturase [Sciscionella marina]